MSLYKCSEGIYGIVSTMPWWYKLLCNIPLINRLYTKEFSINITSRTKEGTPILGIFESFRLFWFANGTVFTKKFEGKFVFYARMTNLHLSHEINGTYGFMELGTVDAHVFKKFTIDLTK